MLGRLLESKYMPARCAVPLFLLLPGFLMFGAEPPVIDRPGVVNTASQRPAALGGAIARGSLITIYGVRFASLIAANRVTLTIGGRSHALTLLHADTHRIEAWIPPDSPIGPGQLTVTSNGSSTAPEPVTILKSAPGLFSANRQGWGPARSSNTPADSVEPGGKIALLATGVASADRPEVWVGNVAARVLSFHGPAVPKYMAEIAIQVPSEAPEGCYVPVHARVPGAPPSNMVTIAIHRGGGACASGPADPAGGWNGQRTGILLLSRTVRRTLDAPKDHLEDEFNAGFFDVPQAKARSSPLLMAPPPGVCTTWAGSMKANTALGASIWDLLFGGIPGKGLDAGTSIAIHNQTVQMEAPRVNGAPGLYRRVLSGGPGRVALRNRLPLDSGRLGMSGSGGPQVGPFTVALPVPLPFTVPTRPVPIPRSRPVIVEWSAATSGGTMAIALIGADPNRNIAGMAYCVAPEAAGRFVIPADLVSQLPPGRGGLVMASWRRQNLNPPPHGIVQMIGLSGFSQSWEVRIE